MEERRGFAQFVAVLALVITISFIVWATLPRVQPVIEMDANINPDHFKTSQQSVLTLTLKNNDQANAHSIDFRFLTYPLVHLYIGVAQLMPETPDSGNYTYGFILQPAEKIEQPFVVKVSELPIGIASQEFSVRVKAYADGRLVTTNEVRFKVE